MLKRCNEGIFDNCAILFFILLFLILFTNNGVLGRAITNEVE